MSEIKQAELDLIHKVTRAGESGTVEVTAIRRRSDRPFDVEFEGSYVAGFLKGCGLQAWLPLAVIRDSNWPRLAAMSDYPQMVRAGDWSGIRDSEPEAIWAMFEKVIG